MQLQATDQPSNRNHGKLNLRRNILQAMMMSAYNSVLLVHNVPMSLSVIFIVQWTA